MRSLSKRQRVIGIALTGLIILLGAFFLKRFNPGNLALSQPAGPLVNADENLRIQHAQTGTDHPNTYLNLDEIEAIKVNVSAGEEPWKTAFDQMIGDANRALTHKPYSITKNGGPNDGHDYHTERPYCGWTAVDNKLPDCRDGQLNPQADREDYYQAIALGRDIYCLGLAYILTQEPRYADKAISLIRVWCMDTETRMAPYYTNSNSRIELAISLPGMIYGADLIYGYPGWSDEENESFEAWVDQITKSFMSWQRLNNFENWRIHFIALTGSFLKNEYFLHYAFERYKELIPIQIDQKGRLVEELDRTGSLSYSLYALNAMIQTAEIARHQGINLYDYSTSENKGLKLALDYHAQFADKDWPDNWPYQQNGPLKGDDNVALYELAYSHWQEPAYLKVIEYWGRPMTERRVHWHISLTHARR